MDFPSTQFTSPSKKARKAREVETAHAVDLGPVPTSIHVPPDPKLDTDPDVNEAPAPVLSPSGAASHNRLQYNCPPVLEALSKRTQRERECEYP